MHKINNLKQGDLSVPDYYHKLNSLWREFDILTILSACVCEGRIACTCDAKSESAKHTHLIRLMQFLMGLNDVYQPIRSTILANDPLPNVKDAFYVVSREEFHIGLHLGGSSTKKSQPATFLISHTVDRCYELNGYPAGFKRNLNLSKQSRNNNNKRFNGNSEVNHSLPSTSGSLSSSFINEQMMKLLCLINEKPSLTINMSGLKPNLFKNNVSLKLPNFYNNIVFFNLNFEKFFCAKSKYVMYNVTLGWIIDSGANQHMTDSTKDMFNIVDISSLMLTIGHPNGTLAKITTIGSLRLTSGIVLFDVLVVPEYNDLNLGKIMGTGSETGDLYLFDLDKIGKCVTTKSNSMFVCHVSSELWHCRLGHPADQVLSILGESEINSLNFFDIQSPKRPYDEEGGSSNVEGNTWVTSDDCENTIKDEVINVATKIGENVTSEGSVQTNQNGEGPSNILETSPILRRFTRQNTLPSKLNDCVVSSNVKYGLKKYVCYDNLSSSNLCFSTTLNKSSEPKTFHEASQNLKWIEAMNLKMEALHRNNTYVLADLSPGRKAIWCKWIRKIKYKSFDKIDSKNDVFIAILMYVDDIVVSENNGHEIDKFKKFLSSKFMIKDFGLLKYFLGIEVLENKNGMCLSQKKYCLELLNEYGLLACKPTATSLQRNVVLNHEESDNVVQQNVSL
ncbi:ribonuclease H-like domain-containing protein [Tanacetum coccineum]